MWIEFWWASFLAILLIGWCYGRAWSKAVTRGGIWVTIYCLMFALSIFMVVQSLQAMLFRLLLLAFPVLFAWWFAAGVGATLRVSHRLRLAASGGSR
jgi:hypothetical protein